MRSTIDFARGNLRALQESRLRFVFAYAANRKPATLAEIRRVKRESIDPGPLAHLEIAVHPTAANYEATVAAELDVPLNVHLHESPADPATGQLDALRRAGALRPGLVTDHTIQMTDAELDELVAHDAALDFAPQLDWVSQLVFNAAPANVEWVFVAGRALKRDGRVIGDQARVIADAQAASDRNQKLLGRNSPR
ncbi:MAG TPA: hypothetical protein VJ757_08380 [Pseudonocardiaceae bacterium]|nr:hypothetical protein [Pseudonocardiaceae bacterium]